MSVTYKVRLSVNRFCLVQSGLTCYFSSLVQSTVGIKLPLESRSLFVDILFDFKLEEYRFCGKYGELLPAVGFSG